jgi:hypothetical protein
MGKEGAVAPQGDAAGRKGKGATPAAARRAASQQRAGAAAAACGPHLRPQPQPHPAAAAAAAAAPPAPPLPALSSAGALSAASAASDEAASDLSPRASSNTSSYVDTKWGVIPALRSAATSS